MTMTKDVIEKGQKTYYKFQLDFKCQNKGFPLNNHSGGKKMTKETEFIRESGERIQMRDTCPRGASVTSEFNFGG